MVASEPPRRIVILAYPGVQPLDVVGPSEVFSAADAIVADDRGGLRRAYEIEVVAPSPEPIMTRTGGYGIAPLRTTKQCRGPIDTLMVAGGFGVYEAVEDDGARPLDPLRGRPLAAASPASARAASCWPRAGLLDGKRATTHWSSLRRAGAPPPRGRGGPEPDLRPRRRRLDLGRRHLGHGPGAGAGRGGPGARGRPRGRPLAGPVPEAPGRPGPVQLPPRRPARRARSRCARSRAGSPTTWTATCASRRSPSGVA